MTSGLGGVGYRGDLEAAGELERMRELEGHLEGQIKKWSARVDNDLGAVGGRPVTPGSGSASSGGKGTNSQSSGFHSIFGAR